MHLPVFSHSTEVYLLIANLALLVSMLFTHGTPWSDREPGREGNVLETVLTLQIALVLTADLTWLLMRANGF